MGKVTKDGIIGSVGNLVFYSLDGQNLVRSKPGRRTKKRTKAEKTVNDNFGMASSQSAVMLKVLKMNFLFPVPLLVRNNFCSWFYKSYTLHLKEPVWDLATNMAMCQLNAAVDLHDFLFAGITVSDRGKSVVAVSIPELIPVKHLKAPPGTKKVNMKLYAVRSNNETASGYPLLYQQEISFVYNNTPVPARDILMELKVKAGNIIVVAVAIEYETMKGDKAPTERRWLPAAAVAIGRLKK